MMYLATNPDRCHACSRCTGIWISPYADDGHFYIVDTAALAEDDALYRGPDAWPTDTLLVVVSPREHHRLTEEFSRLPYPIGGPAVAAGIIDRMAKRDPDLARRLRWRLES